MTRTKTERLEILVTPKIRRALAKLADRDAVSMGQVVRNLVEAEAKRRRVWRG